MTPLTNRLGSYFTDEVMEGPCPVRIPELPRVTTKVVRLNPEVWGAQIMDAYGEKEEGRG